MALAIRNIRTAGKKASGHSSFKWISEASAIQVYI